MRAIIFLLLCCVSIEVSHASVDTPPAPYRRLVVHLDRGMDDERMDLFYSRERGWSAKKLRLTQYDSYGTNFLKLGFVKVVFAGDPEDMLAAVQRFHGFKSANVEVVEPSQDDFYVYEIREFLKSYNPTPASRLVARCRLLSSPVNVLTPQHNIARANDPALDAKIQLLRETLATSELYAEAGSQKAQVNVPILKNNIALELVNKADSAELGDKRALYIEAISLFAEAVGDGPANVQENLTEARLTYAMILIAAAEKEEDEEVAQPFIDEGLSILELEIDSGHAHAKSSMIIGRLIQADKLAKRLQALVDITEDAREWYRIAKKGFQDAISERPNTVPECLILLEHNWLRLMAGQEQLEAVDPNIVAAIQEFQAAQKGKRTRMWPVALEFFKGCPGSLSPEYIPYFIEIIEDPEIDFQLKDYLANLYRHPRLRALILLQANCFFIKPATIAEILNDPLMGENTDTFAQAFIEHVKPSDTQKFLPTIASASTISIDAAVAALQCGIGKLDSWWRLDLDDIATTLIRRDDYTTEHGHALLNALDTRGHGRKEKVAAAKEILRIQ